MKTQSYSMPDMVYAPVELGTIRLGHLEDHNGQVTPIKDDKFTITRLVKVAGRWVEHPLQEKLLALAPPPAGQGTAERKLREIPIRIMYDAPDLTVRARYEAFNVKQKRPVCASTTAGRARRMSNGAAEDVACIGPDACDFAQQQGIRCKFFGRIMVQIEGQPETDNGFMLRSTSINTLRNFEAKLFRYWALFGKRLTGVPFRLVLRTKTTAASFWRPFYYCDLELAEGLSLPQAAIKARAYAAANEEAGLDLAAWEGIVRAGLDNGALAGSDVEAEMMSEFYVEPPSAENAPGQAGEGASVGAAVPLLTLRTLAVADQRQSEAAADPSPATQPVQRENEVGKVVTDNDPIVTAELVSTGSSTQRPPRGPRTRELPPKRLAAAVSQHPPVRQNGFNSSSVQRLTATEPNANDVHSTRV